MNCNVWYNNTWFMICNILYIIWYIIFDILCRIYDIRYMIYVSHIRNDMIWHIIYDIWYIIYNICFRYTGFPVEGGGTQYFESHFPLLWGTSPSPRTGYPLKHVFSLRRLLSSLQCLVDILFILMLFCKMSL